MSSTQLSGDCGCYSDQWRALEQVVYNMCRGTNAGPSLKAGEPETKAEPTTTRGSVTVIRGLARSFGFFAIPFSRGALSGSAAPAGHAMVFASCSIVRIAA